MTTLKRMLFNKKNNNNVYSFIKSTLASLKTCETLSQYDSYLNYNFSGCILYVCTHLDWILNTLCIFSSLTNRCHLTFNTDLNLSCPAYSWGSFRRRCKLPLSAPAMRASQKLGSRNIPHPWSKLQWPPVPRPMRKDGPAPCNFLYTKQKSQTNQLSSVHLKHWNYRIPSLCFKKMKRWGNIL